MRIRHITTSALLALVALQAGAWGQKGHDTTAFIAEQHLTEPTLKAVTELLDGKSPVYYANWLDNASHTPEYDYSKTWHYKNIDEDMTFDTAVLHSRGDIVTALNEQIAVLGDKYSTRPQKQLALKIVIHLLGDIHQPMHLGHASDLGGNKWDVKYFGTKTNLHGVWDSRLPESAHKWSYTEWQQQLDRLTPEEETAILSGTPADWGRETYEICKDVYGTTPQGTDIKYDYIAKWTPTIEQQFMRGGLRLADVLNSLFDPSYTPHTSAVKR